MIIFYAQARSVSPRFEKSVNLQAEKEKGELEVEVEHMKSSGSKSLTSVSKVRLSEMRLKREVTQLKQQLTLVCSIGLNSIQLV